MEPVTRSPIQVSSATVGDLPELADVAARTFPLACPPSVTPADIAAVIAENLSQDRFRDYLTDPERIVLLARAGDRIAGYAMLIRGTPDDDHVRRAVPQPSVIEISKMYVLPSSHGTGVAAALMTAALERARDRAASCVWLGVNQQNRRAQRFYAKHGFTVNGTRTFRLGARIEDDYVLVRPV